jgi:hypothetical protein
MGINYDKLALPKGQSAAEGRRQRKLTKAQLLDEAYARVDALDQGICWVTGRTTRTNTTDARVFREHHHLGARRVRPEWRHDEDRIITVCKEAHDLITAGKIDVEGDHRRRGLFFHWDCKPSERPFHILPKRLRKTKAA